MLLTVVKNQDSSREINGGYQPCLATHKDTTLAIRKRCFALRKNLPLQAAGMCSSARLSDPTVGGSGL